MGISLNGNLIFSAISHDEWDNDLFDVHTCLHNNNCWDPDKNLNESLEITSLFSLSIAIIFIIVAWKKSHKNFIALMCRYFWWFYRWQNFYFFSIVQIDFKGVWMYHCAFLSVQMPRNNPWFCAFSTISFCSNISLLRHVLITVILCLKTFH